VPIVSGLAGLVLAAIVSYAWPYLERGMDVTSQAILGAGSFGLFAYGVLNRLLIVTGLHHILNNFAWFIVGDYHGATGDLKRFFAGDPTAGAFMLGFFPVMMFGLPGACLAMVMMNLFGVRLGFSFSAGLFDYVLNFSHAQRPLLLLPIGAAYFALYYGVFRFCIVRLNLATPGREIDDAIAQSVAPATPDLRAQAFGAAGSSDTGCGPRCAGAIGSYGRPR
jgi:PTS system N-acetylglucosamine-specific IIC component